MISSTQQGEIVSEGSPRVTVVIHDKPWTVRPGEPQSVRDAYDRLLADRGELWTGEGQTVGAVDCPGAR